MKNIYRSLLALFLIGIAIGSSQSVQAGNEDRSGQAGASELLINPWARSSGWGSVSTANARGLEAMFSNIAGTAFTKKTELVFSQTQWLKGSDVNISAFGLTQKVGETGVLGLAVMSMSFGKVQITTVDQPDGGIGTFTPSLLNINVSYAKEFSNSIYGGVNFKIISEAISDVSAQGLAIDAGIQYVTGAKENIKFGIALKNVGPTMKFSGDGLSFRTDNDSYTFTAEQRSCAFELPSSLNIGAAYDFFINNDHTLTLAGNFTSNSFTKDQYTLGVEYGFKSYLMLRTGYTYEKGLWKKADRTSAFTGPSAGFSVQVPMNKEKGSIFSIDYSFRATDPFQGTHSIGVRMSL